MASQGGILRLLKDSAGVVLDTVEKTATFNSEAFSIGEFEEFGLMNVYDETSGSGTWDVTVQVSPNGGTDWFSMPAAVNSQTAASMTQITADGNDIKNSHNPLPNNSNARARFVFTAASSPTYNITSYLFASMVKRATDI